MLTAAVAHIFSCSCCEAHSNQHLGGSCAKNLPVFYYDMVDTWCVQLSTAFPIQPPS